jgi:transcriptional regulator with XRE-family HTH domain
MTNIRELLGSNIRTYRNKLGISQEKLAETVNMATNYLGLIEGGKKFPSANMIERIAAALGKDTPALFALAPLHQDWKEHILLKMDALIGQELAAIWYEKSQNVPDPLNMQFPQTLVTDILQTVEEAVETALAKRENS